MNPPALRYYAPPQRIIPRTLVTEVCIYGSTPAELRERFRALPSDPLTLSHCWVRTADGSPAQVSTTWFTGDATLGSLNRESAWTQRRLVVGYWRTPDDEAVRLRLRIMHNGRDFACGFVWNHQQGPRILTGAHFVTCQGDFHPQLDRPADGTFRTRDLRVRYEIEGRGTRVERLGERLFALTAGGRRAFLHAAPGLFDGQPVNHWETGQDGNTAWVDFIFYTGAERPFNPAHVAETNVSFALELLTAGETPLAYEIESAASATHRVFTWQADRPYEVTVPTQSDKRPWP